VTVLVMEFPWITLTAAGAGARVNEGAPVTVSTRVAVLVIVPEVPVIVRVACPGAVELPAVNVRVLVVAAVAELKDAVTPEGRPDTASFTDPLKPFCGVILMVAAPVAPAATDRVCGDTERPNPGGFEIPVRSLMRLWPAGVPHPVARS